MNAPQPRRLLSRKEVRALLNRGDATIWRWEKAGILRPIYIKGYPQYDQDEVLRLAAQGDGSKPRTPGAREAVA